MPWQLIYTSAPRGLTPGQSGYCTVARSRDLREALIPRLEKLSYYTPETNRNPVICAHRIIELRGQRYHALTRIVDAGLDFTKRRKFIAHHLIFQPGELAASPATIFLRWKGWLEHWEGDPQWLETTAPLPASRELDRPVEGTDVWITGDEKDREEFLWTLEGSSWDLTFTNCFQPGDHAADFNVKAIWPNTAGFDAAAKLGAEPIRLRDLKVAPAREAPIPAVAPIPQAAPIAPAQTKKRKPILFWPWLAGAATLIALALAIFFRDHPTIRVETPQPQPQPVEVIHETAPAPIPAPITKPDTIFTSNPTWLALAENGQLGPAPEIEKLFKALRDAELFGKDIKATLQNVRSGASEEVAVNAQPHDGKIVFKSPTAEIELASENGALTLNSNARQPLALEIDSGARILIIPKGAPLAVPKSNLIVDANAQTVSMDPNFEKRLRKIVLPRGSQLALRPRKDSLDAHETSFALSPSTTFDLAAIHKQVDRVLKEKSKSVEALRHELQELKAEEKKLLTNAKTPEELKRKDDLIALKNSFPKAQQELHVLRERAAAVPENLSKIEAYSLFLCQNTVNTEIVRFEDAAP